MSQNPNDYSQTSVSLIQRIAMHSHGDDWSLLEETYKPFLANQVRKFTDMASYADDISQEVWMAVLGNIKDFERQRIGSFRRWLKEITIRRIQERRRSDHRFRTNAVNNSDADQRLLQLADPASEPSLEWDKEEEKRILRQAIKTAQQEFSPLHWTAFERTYIKGEAAGLVAESLDITKGSLHTSNHRIRDRLKELVAIFG